MIHPLKYASDFRPFFSQHTLTQSSNTTPREPRHCETTSLCSSVLPLFISYNVTILSSFLSSPLLSSLPTSILPPLLFSQPSLFLSPPSFHPPSRSIPFFSRSLPYFPLSPSFPGPSFLTSSSLLSHSIALHLSRPSVDSRSDKPFFTKTLDHWPHIIKLGDISTITSGIHIFFSSAACAYM